MHFCQLTGALLAGRRRRVGFFLRVGVQEALDLGRRERGSLGVDRVLQTLDLRPRVAAFGVELRSGHVVAHRDDRVLDVGRLGSQVALTLLPEP